MTLHRFKRFAPLSLVMVLQVCLIIGVPALHTALHLSLASFLGLLLLGVALHGYLLARALRYARQHAHDEHRDVDRTNGEG
jgi:ABC-type transport system involved in cytochrome bd biosynthesis fused ATPase/permease subunit